MRNVVKYPVTKEEVINAIDEASDHYARKGHIGDIRPLALRLAKEWIQERGPEFFNF